MRHHPVTRILLIDDEPAIAETLSAYAGRDGMSVEYAKDGEAGLDLFGRRKFDVVVVDWMLPGISGPEIVKTIREKSDIPILMISARDEESDIVVGLELGADDYVTKPFSMQELENALGSQGRHIGPVLLALGWTRMRTWGGTQPFRRYWLPSGFNK